MSEFTKGLKNGITNERVQSSVRWNAEHLLTHHNHKLW